MTDTFQADYRALDHTFRVRSNVPGMGSVIPHLFAAFEPSGGNGDRTTYELLERTDEETPYELMMDGTSIQRVRNPGSMVDWVIADISRRSLVATRRMVAVHAGVVTFRGRAALLPAAPGRGKSTTVAGLVRRGFGFLSDEAALIDPADGQVHPFARPMMLTPTSVATVPGLRAALRRRPGFRHFKHHIVPEDIRPGALGSASPVAFVVAPSYAEGGETRLESMTRADALQLLLDQCFNLDAMRSLAVETLADVVRSASCYRLSIGEIEPAVELIGGLFEVLDTGGLPGHPQA